MTPGLGTWRVQGYLSFVNRAPFTAISRLRVQGENELLTWHNTIEIRINIPVEYTL